MTAEELIVYFKEKEVPEDVFLVMKDDFALNFLAAWKQNDAMIPDGMIIKMEDSKMWTWLWSDFHINVNIMSNATGFAPDKVRRIGQMVIQNRFVYPDGTLHKFVERYMRQFITDVLTKGA